MATHSQGAFGKLIMEPGASAHTFNSSSHAIEFLSETLSRRGRLIGGQGIRGTLSDASERVREGASFYQGEITMYVSPKDFHDFCSTEANGGLDLFGMTESPTDTFTVDDAGLSSFGILIDTDYDTWEYSDCKLDYWQIRSRAPFPNDSGEPDMIYLTLGIIASDETPGTAWPSPAPSIGTAATDAPYVFADTSGDTGVTLNGTERSIEEFVIRVDHRLKAKYTNSLTPHSIRPRNRIVRAMFRLPWNSTNDDLYGQAVAGAEASVKMVNGGYSTKIVMERFQVPPQTPVIPGKDQISLVVQGVARSLGTDKELYIVNDTT